MIRLTLYIQPNASQTKVVGLFDGRLKIQIAAPAVDNKANIYLQKWLAAEFKVPKSSVVLLKGEHSRQKYYEIREPKRLPEWVKLMGE